MNKEEKLKEVIKDIIEEYPEFKDKKTITQWKNKIHSFALKKLFGEVLLTEDLCPMFQKLAKDNFLKMETESKPITFYSVGGQNAV